MYREAVPVVKSSGSAVILDRGSLSHTMRGPSGFYTLSEVGAGTKALALVGTVDEVFQFMEENASSGVRNVIPALPDIYMGVQPYRPGVRFTGLFPLHDTILALVSGVAAFAPGTELTDIVSSVGDIKGATEFSTSPYSHSRTPTAPSREEIYVRFHYLQLDQMFAIARRKAQFRGIAQILRRTLQRR